MAAPFVIVGASQAGVQIADSLRREGYEGGITLIGEEPELPYQRPPLSKEYLQGEMDEERLFFKAESFYADRGIDCVLGLPATGIDRGARTVALEDGRSFPYDKLALTVGARVRSLPVKGTDLAGVFYLRTLGDSRRIKAAMSDAKSVAVIGGGFIGLEVAAAACKSGKPTAIVEAQDRLMPRVVAPLLSDYYREVHTGHGATVLLNAQVSEIAGEGGKVAEVVCADGKRFPADLVVIGIGVVPNVELAQASGLACDNGIVVDELTRTSDPDIVAAGDCTNHPNTLLGARLRLESVQNAIDQARTAAATMAGQEKPYAEIPWFWSDQYDLKLQMVGISAGFDEIVTRGDMAAHKFSLFYYAAGRLIAIDSVNSPGDHMAGRRLLAAGKTVPPETARDPGVNLRDLARQ